MSALPLQETVKQVGVWIALVLLVILASLLFSLLGTLCIAVAVGLMMGVVRRWRWQTIPVSVVFLLAGLTLGQAAKAELDLQHRLIMAGICFGAFWGVYALTWLIMCLEQGGETANLASPRSASAPGTPAANRSETSPVPIQGTRAELSLRDLQGTWVNERGPWDGQATKRRLEITEKGFCLEIRDAAGLTRLEARGDLKLEAADGDLKLRFVESPGRQGRHSD